MVTKSPMFNYLSVLISTWTIFLSLLSLSSSKGHHTGFGCWKVNQTPCANMARCTGSWFCEHGSSYSPWIHRCILCWRLDHHLREWHRSHQNYQEVSTGLHEQEIWRHCGWGTYKYGNYAWPLLPHSTHEPRGDQNRSSQSSRRGWITSVRAECHSCIGNPSWISRKHPRCFQENKEDPWKLSQEHSNREDMSVWERDNQGWTKQLLKFPTSRQREWSPHMVETA